MGPARTGAVMRVRVTQVPKSGARASLGAQRAVTRRSPVIRPQAAANAFAPAKVGRTQEWCPHRSKLRAKAKLSHGRALRSGPTRKVVCMVFERFTERAIKAVMAAQNEARTLGRNEVTTRDLLLGLIAEDSKTGGYLNTGITIRRARDAVKSLAPPTGGASKGQGDIPFSSSAKDVFDSALDQSKGQGHNFVAPEHLVLALFATDSTTIGVLFRKLGADPDFVKREALRQLSGQTAGEGWRKPSMPQGGAQGADPNKKSVLEEFCRDLCQEAMEGRLDPVIGRDEEVLRTMQILARRRKNNPILLGEPGVGKTAIAEGLAQCIAESRGVLGKALPEFLVGKRVLSLDLGLLMAGAKERGELENRVTKLISEVKESGDVILLIDEVHTLVGAGSVGRGGGGGGGLDISNLMKPALARGELQCIGATTLDEHMKYIEKDAALERRFQPVTVNEPTPSDALAVLEGLRERYERYHQCMYTEEALEAAVQLSARYIADRHLPDKAIDLVDEAGSRARIATFAKRKEQLDAAGEPTEDSDVKGREEYEALWEQLQQVSTAKDQCVRGQTFEEAALLQRREQELKALLMPGGEDSSDAGFLSVVGKNAIQEIVTQWTGVPLRQMQEDDKRRMLQLGDTLARKVIGQTEAVAAISKAMQRSSCGLKNPNRPIATMLFSGPTGVGKTELAKQLALETFGSKEAMIRLDMSEFMERHTVSKLVGSPPGYVGYGEGGKLTEAVRRRPFSLILLDEVEKAHPDVFNLLLQVLEDGMLTDSQGRSVSFKETVIILTSNLGSNVIAKGGGAKLGFELPGEDGAESQYTRIRGLVMEELRSYFKPELLNRLDEVVVFRLLHESEIKRIADLMLDETARRMADKGIGFQVTKPMMEKIVEEGYDKMYGARPLRRTIVRLIEDYLAESLMKGELREGEVAKMDIDENGDISVRPCLPGECVVEEDELEESDIAYSYVDLQPAEDMEENITAMSQE